MWAPNWVNLEGRFAGILPSRWLNTRLPVTVGTIGKFASEKMVPHSTFSHRERKAWQKTEKGQKLQWKLKGLREMLLGNEATCHATVFVPPWMGALGNETCFRASSYAYFP